MVVSFLLVIAFLLHFKPEVYIHVVPCLATWVLPT